VDGVILRVQAGSTYADPRYQEYVKGCKDNGIPFLTYAYFKGVSVADAIKESNDAYSRMDKDSQGFAIDIEEVSMNDLVAGGQAFINNLKSKGVPNVGLYSGASFYKTHNLQNIQCDWTWIAAYGSNDGRQHTDPKIAGEDLWQYTSVGHVAGIAGNVDLNVESDQADFHLFGSHTVIAPSPVSNPSDKLSYWFSTSQSIVQTLSCSGNTDIRVAPSHNAQYVRDTQKGEVFHVFEKYVDAQGHCWDNLGGANWADEASGIFYWLDNPALQKAQTTQPTYYTVKSGDTAGAIAKRFGVSLAQLKSWNHLDSHYTVYANKSIRVK
jgi:GH25 family lysozyme M1 (1,4-beta-N-acetylmuramidase)